MDVWSAARTAGPEGVEKSLPAPQQHGPDGAERHTSRVMYRASLGRAGCLLELLLVLVVVAAVSANSAQALDSAWTAGWHQPRVWAKEPVWPMP